jgi:hypothetical protein
MTTREKDETVSACSMGNDPSLPIDSLKFSPRIEKPVVSRKLRFRGSNIKFDHVIAILWVRGFQNDKGHFRNQSSLRNSRHKSMKPTSLASVGTLSLRCDLQGAEVARGSSAHSSRLYDHNPERPTPRPAKFVWGIRMPAASVICHHTPSKTPTFAQSDVPLRTINPRRTRGL